MNNLWDRFEKENVVWDVYLYLFSIILSYAASNRKFSKHEISHEKKFVPTKYPHKKISNRWEKTSGPRNTLEKTFWTHKIPIYTRWHNCTRPTRPTMARDRQYLVHSLPEISNKIFEKETLKKYPRRSLLFSKVILCFLGSNHWEVSIETWELLFDWQL